MKILSVQIILFPMLLLLRAVSATATRNPPIGAMYIEVNTNNFRNLGCYTVKEGPNAGQPLFKIGIIFAANINYDISTQSALLYFNPNVQTVLDHASWYIRPLQEQGIKVLLSILGNHQGAGISNFPTVEAARAFAVQLNAAVRQYGLDGIDFDDQYAEYGNNGTPLPNADSFIWLLQELRKLMPDKIMSFYFYPPAPAAYSLGINQLNAEDFLDYSWNAMYGSFMTPSVNLTKQQLGPAAIWVGNTPGNQAVELAELTISGGYGVYLYYDLLDEDMNTYLSEISYKLYKGISSLAKNCIRSWPPSNTAAANGPRHKMRQHHLNSGK